MKVSINRPLKRFGDGVGDGVGDGAGMLGVVV
jgi:hypothetical protein